MSNNGRTPHDDEKKLWEAVSKTVRPLTGSNISSPVDAVPVAKSIHKPPRQAYTEASKPYKNRTFESEATQLPPQLDRRTDAKLRKGKIPVEGVLDLHGMTQEEAHAALKGFVTRAFGQQKRCVLVITGKGTRSDGPGILKTRLPIWLGIEPLNNMVLKSVAAHRKHGGDGAYYLYLKRLRPGRN